FLQDLCQLDQDDQPVFQFADAGDVIQFALFEDIRRVFDVAGGHLKDLRRGIDDESDQFAFHFSDQDTVLFVLIDLFFAEAFAQVDDGDDLAAKVDDAFNVIGRVRNRGDLRNAHDLMD